MHPVLERLAVRQLHEESNQLYIVAESN